VIAESHGDPFLEPEWASRLDDLGREHKRSRRKFVSRLAPIGRARRTKRLSFCDESARTIWADCEVFVRAIW
jgi:hypothetical protein